MRAKAQPIQKKKNNRLSKNAYSDEGRVGWGANEGKGREEGKGKKELQPILSKKKKKLSSTNQLKGGGKGGGWLKGKVL